MLIISQGVAAAASTCADPVIAYLASGTFGAQPVSGKDIFKLAGEPFSMTVYVCQTKAAGQTGPDYSAYGGVELTGTIKTALLSQPFSIKPSATTLILVQPSGGPDSVQVRGDLNILGAKVTIKAAIALPAGTLNTTHINPFAKTSIVTSKSGFVYSEGTASTTLPVIGTASATVYTGKTPAAVPALHSSAARMITAHSDGSESTQPLRGARVDLGIGSDPVLLQFYASGVRDASDVRVQIAGQNAPVRYAGASGHFPGLDEVTVEVPRSLAGMRDASVVLTVDGIAAEPVEIQIQ